MSFPRVLTLSGGFNHLQHRGICEDVITVTDSITTWEEQLICLLANNVNLCFTIGVVVHAIYPKKMIREALRARYGNEVR